MPLHAGTLVRYHVHATATPVIYLRNLPWTGAGKTFTLSSLQPDNIGMMPRAAAAIFNEIRADALHHYTVHMSYMQIYMEMIQVRGQTAVLNMTGVFYKTAGLNTPSVCDFLLHECTLSY